MPELNRREFVTRTAAAIAGACAFCNAGLLLGESSGGGAPVDIGSTSDYAKDGVTDKWVGSDKFFVVREGDRIFALGAICTHKKTTLKLKDGAIFCPGHGSHFSNDGKVEKGPAKRSLVHLAISKDSEGKLRVDPSQRFEEDHWDDPKSFVTVS
jgi:nitrite reductase/ring-hydroxylating ferredoxin subunit